ncbi:alpha/beta fold hydrolase [Nocardioides KLBMP 9356]|uniref:Alpha/beta fold hydrolase n=1 Tax=Nocardioides potassii TaxID=2911371 RepID=A0ABS9H852_9ACTN|nr:alpha/beta fold hydrolase [Nocardioides potassii]MCF6377402.1 alpha/beta fold hydrolase [Nocardioides potassii]
MTTYDGPFSERRVVPRPDVDLAVFEGGAPDGPVVLHVHGYPDTHRLWRGVADLLAEDHRVVAYDTRGQGDSVTDAPDEAFAVDVLADDLLAVVDAVSPDRPVHLVGHDWGSIQAWEAVCRPGAEERIASFCAISGPHLAHVSAWVRRVLRRPTPRGVLDLVGQAVSSSYVPFLVSPLAPLVLGALGQRTMVSGLRYYRANLGARSRDPGDQRTRVPVLQLVPTRDVALRPATAAASDDFVDAIERRRIPHGHWVARTHPELVAAEVGRFVRERERAAAGRPAPPR